MSHPGSVLGPGYRRLLLVLGVAVFDGQELVVSRLPPVFVDLQGHVMVAVMVDLHPATSHSDVLVPGLPL